MKTYRPGFLATACFFGIVHQLGAQVFVVSNLDNVSNFSSGIYAIESRFGDSFDGVPYNHRVAQSFTTGSVETTLQGVTLSMATGRYNGGGFRIYIWPDDGGIPSRVREGAILDGDSTPDVAGRYTYTPQSTLTLAASSTYWIVSYLPLSAPPDRAYEWSATRDLTEISATGWSMGPSASLSLPLNLSEYANVGWETNPNYSLRAGISVSETAAVPEPATTAMVAGVCLLAAAGLRRLTTSR